jgi:hypothetical protein
MVNLSEINFSFPDDDQLTGQLENRQRKYIFFVG